MYMCVCVCARLYTLRIKFCFSIFYCIYTIASPTFSFSLSLSPSMFVSFVRPPVVVILSTDNCNASPTAALPYWLVGVLGACSLNHFSPAGCHSEQWIEGEWPVELTRLTRQQKSREGAWLSSGARPQFSNVIAAQVGFISDFSFRQPAPLIPRLNQRRTTRSTVPFSFGARHRPFSFSWNERNFYYKIKRWQKDGRRMNWKN